MFDRITPHLITNDYSTIDISKILDTLEDPIETPIETSTPAENTADLKLTHQENFFFKMLEESYPPPYNPAEIIPPYIFHSHTALVGILKKENEEFSIESPEHRRRLSVAFHYFNSRELTELSEDDRLLCLKLHEENRQNELSRKLPPLKSIMNDKVLDGLRISSGLGTMVVKGLAIDSILQLSGFMAKDLTLTETDFDRIFPDNSFKTEAIPALFKSGIKLSLPLQQKLTTRRLEWIEENAFKGPVNPTIASPSENLKEVCDFVEELNSAETSPAIETDASKLVNTAEKVIASESGIDDEMIHVELDKKKAESPSGKRKILNDALKIGEEIGKAVHTWMQHSSREEGHLKLTEKAHREFSACMEALSLDADINEFAYKSRPEIQKLIEKKLIENHGEALNQRVIVTREYADAVARTKEALKECRLTFEKLGSQKTGLKELGAILKYQQEKKDEYYRKRSVFLKIGRAICDGIEIVGKVVLATAAPQTAAASRSGEKNKSLVLAKEGIKVLDHLNEQQWDKSQGKYKRKLNQVLEGANALHIGREATQSHLNEWLKNRQQEREFLVMNPDQFLSVAYRRFLLEELAEGKNGIRTVTRSRDQCKMRFDLNTQRLTELKGREKSLSESNVHSKSTLSKLSAVRIAIANLSAENSLLEIDFNRHQNILSGESSVLGAIEGRLKHIASEDSLPEHLRTDANRLPFAIRLESSNERLNVLQSKLTDKQQLTPEEVTETTKQLRNELITNTRLKQEEFYKNLKASPTNICGQLPGLLIDSIHRQNSVANSHKNDEEDLQTLLSKESISKQSFENAKSLLKGAENTFETARKNEVDAQDNYDKIVNQIKALLPDRSVDYKSEHGKVSLNLRDFTHPDWSKTIDEKIGKSEQADLKSAKLLIAGLTALEATLNRMKYETSIAEQPYKNASAIAEHFENEYLSDQKARLGLESKIDEMDQSIQGEGQLRHTLWKMLEEMSDEERLTCCQILSTKLADEKPESSGQKHAIRADQMRCHQIARQAYRKLWDGVDPAQRIDRFQSHVIAAKIRLTDFNLLLSSIRGEIDVLSESDSNPDLLKELCNEEKTILAHIEIEKDNVSTYLLGNNLDTKILEIREMSGESADLQLRTLQNQHVEHLNRINQKQMFRQLAGLSHTFELLLGDISTRWDQEWQKRARTVPQDDNSVREHREKLHKIRTAPQFVTQALTCAANFVYMWKAYWTLANDAETSIGLKNNKGIALSPLEQDYPLVSFFLELTLENKIANYFIPTLNCLRSVVQLSNTLHLMKSGALTTLFESFTTFAKEQKAALNLFHTQVSEQLKDNQKMLLEINGYMRAFNEEMKEAFWSMNQKIEASRQSLEKRFDSQESRRRLEACVRHCIEQSTKCNDSIRQLIGTSLINRLEIVRFNGTLSHDPCFNGFNAAEILDISTISGRPKFFAGWLGSHIGQQGIIGVDRTLPSPMLLISSAKHFLEINKNINSDGNCSPELKQLTIDQAKRFEHDIGQLLLLISEQNAQSAKAAVSLEQAKLSWNKRYNEFSLKRDRAVSEKAKQGIVTSRNRMNALVENPSYFVRRFAITRKVIHLLGSDLPLPTETLKTMLHPAEPLSEKIGFYAGMALLSPIIAPIVATVAVVDYAYNLFYPSIWGKKLEWDEEKINPYDEKGRFGHPQVEQRFKNISLIDAGRQPLPQPMNLFLPTGLCEKKRSITLSVRNGPHQGTLQKLPQLQVSKLAMKGFKWRYDDQKKANVEEKVKYEQIFAASTEASPLVEAKVKVFFDKQLSRKAFFTKHSLVQNTDLPAIAKIMGSMKMLEQSQIKSAEIPTVYRSFLESELKKSGNKSDFSKWLGNYRLIPSKQGEIPLALPLAVTNAIDEILKKELMNRRSSKQPTLLPYYEWLYDKNLGFYSLEIIMETNEQSPLECHRFRLFSIEKPTVEALKGTLEECNGESRTLLDHSLLLYTMYCGFWQGLGMPSSESHKLSEKVVLSNDKPFKGYYKSLESKNLFDWISSKKGKESYEQAKSAAFVSNFQDPLFKEYRHQYYLALSLAKLQNKIDSKNAQKNPLENEDLMQYRTASLRSIFADNGLPWPETFELTEEIFKEGPRVESLMRELERLPLSKLTTSLIELHSEMQKICRD